MPGAYAIPSKRFLQILTPMAQVTVLGVEPALPIENTEVTIRFSISNSSYDEKNLSGFVTYIGNAKLPDAAKFRVDNLKPGGTIIGTVKGTAPRAAANAIFQLGYTDDSQPFVGEFRLPSAYGDGAFDVAATYTLAITSIICSRPRNGRNNPDKLTATCKATWEGSDASLPIPPPADDDPVFMVPPTDSIIRRLGDIHSQQTIYPDLMFGPFTSVPGKGPAIHFSYVLVNTSSSESSDATYTAVANGISKAGQVVASIAAPTLSAAWGGIDTIIEAINNAIGASCDGVVATDAFITQSSNLEQYTFASGYYNYGVNFDSEQLGVQTPVACGRAPYYTVWISFVRLSHAS
ncbi:MAG TPA: hypothetical protein VJN89_11370 [Candidatus Acidoferrum sp.]|nr:hypothetical protein [Candidatus Acidoferrum sp.]